MKVKSYIDFLKEQAAPAPAPAPAPAQAPPAQAPPAAQAPPSGFETPPPAQPQASGSTETPQSTTAQQGGQGEEKSGDLSGYNKPEVTKFSETVKKMVDIIKELDKDQLIELRGLLAKFKSIDDAKQEIGKL